MARIKIRGLFTEEELLDILGINKERLAVLRKEQAFPQTALSEWTRVYLEKSILEWIKVHEGLHD